MTSIRPIRINHMNAVVEDFDASIDHFHNVYDAEFLEDLPRDEWRAAIISIAGVMFEIFGPRDFFLHSRHGPHYFGVEYQADIDDARKAVAERGIRIGRDVKLAIHTDPRDCYGVSFEFYSGDFSTRAYPLVGGAMRHLAHWRDNHPLGLTGQKGYTLQVSDLRAAEAFLKDFISATPAYQAHRPEIGADVVGLEVAGFFVELQAPAGEGALSRDLARLGPGIRSTVFGVKDIEAARRYLAGQGIELVPGSAPGRWATTAEANRGLVFEFAD